jgi:hypothetical protein
VPPVVLTLNSSWPGQAEERVLDRRMFMRPFA